MKPLISVITPSLNASRYIEEAIQSVLAQGYEPYEHIVVDGGSTDATVEILDRYESVRWISEPDRGQSDAMNKGFELAQGQITVYLNADDYFEPNAFNAAASALMLGADFVVGRIRIIRADGNEVLNDPAVTLPGMLYWWRPDAYCYNSAGYFYRREVQEAVGGFDVGDHLTMDFGFLLEVARRFELVKIPDILASFRYIPGTKTFENAHRERDLFTRFEKYEALLDEADRLAYIRDRELHFRQQDNPPAQR